MPEYNQNILPILPEAKFSKNGNYENAYFTLGKRKNPPLLLCHGIGANGLQFVDDAHFFAKKGFYVIVPDLRGLGRSKTPKERKESDFSIPNLAADLLAILDKEKIEKTYWVGNSLGGILGLAIMGIDAMRINKFISFGTAYKLNVPEIFIPIVKFGSESLGKEMSAQLAARATSLNKRAQLIIYTMLRDVDMFTVISIAKYVRNYDFIPNALKFSGEILLIKCSLDFAVNQVLGATLKAMERKENFYLFNVKNAGHVGNLDQPEEIRKAILDFIANG